MKTGDEPLTTTTDRSAMTNIEAFKAEPIRQIELRDTEMGLISLAISQLANGSSGSLSQYDVEALKALEQRVARW